MFLTNVKSSSLHKTSVDNSNSNSRIFDTVPIKKTITYFKRANSKN